MGKMTYEELEALADRMSKRIRKLESDLAAAEAARADTLAENVKLNDALGQIHIICSDAEIDPGNVVDRVRELGAAAYRRGMRDRTREIAITVDIRPEELSAGHDVYRAIKDTYPECFKEDSE